MPNSNHFLDQAREALAPLGEITTRPMFGGHTMYCDGLVFALVANDTIYLKANADTEQQFLKAGLTAFRPFPDKPDTMRYHLAPDGFLEDPDVMRHWAGLALEAATAPKRSKKKNADKTKQ